MTGLETIISFVEHGESETVEFKKSTAQLSRAGETLCAFLNGKGGSVLLGVKPNGVIAGQEVSDSTLRDIAGMLDKIDPKAPVSQDTVTVENGNKVVILTAPSLPESAPFTFNGRAFERTGSTTSGMPRSRYENLLLQRAHTRNRWENAYANWIDIDQLDQEEILRTVRMGIESGRMPESTGNDAKDILNRLGVCENGYLLNAAIVLFGTKFMPAFPQCQLRLARFRGKDKSEFLDHRQERGHAFHLLEEAMTFLRRHLPMSGRFEENRLERIDTLAIPALALREALVNAFCHRDYSLPGGAVNVAIYNDRTEIWSDGRLPFGLQPEDLSRDHTSQPRNPIITDVFFRRGLIEQWGRGTQKVVELCEETGCPAPEFDEVAGALMVRFPVPKQLTGEDTTQVTPQDKSLKDKGKRVSEPEATPQDTGEDTPQVTTQDKTLKNKGKGVSESEDTPQDTGEDTPQVTPQDKSLKDRGKGVSEPEGTPQDTGEDIAQDTGEDKFLKDSDKSVHNTKTTGEDTGGVGEEVTGEVSRLLLVMAKTMTRKDLQALLNLKHEDHFRNKYLIPALNQGLIEMTIPDKPNSRNQRYRLTQKGKALQQQLKKEH